MRFSHPLNRKPACEQAVLSGAHRSILVAVLCLYHTLRWTAAEDADLFYSIHVQMLINDTRESTAVSPFQERLSVSTVPLRNKEYRGCNSFFSPSIHTTIASIAKFDQPTWLWSRQRNHSKFAWSAKVSWQKTSIWLWPCHAWTDIGWMSPSTRHHKWSSQDWHYLVQTIPLFNQVVLC